MKRGYLMLVATAFLFFGGMDGRMALAETASSDSFNYSGSNNFASPGFQLEANTLTPATKKYNSGTQTNLTSFLATAGKYLLIATTTLAVLSITIGGIMIATAGPSDRHAKWKTLISLNIMAIVLALLSYSIIQFVRWVLSI